MKIIAKRKNWYLLSTIFLGIGFLFLFLGGLKLGLDFTGGSRLLISGLKDEQKVKEVLEANNYQVYSISQSEDNIFTIKTNALDDDGYKKIIEVLAEAKDDQKEIQEIQFGTIGSTLSRDLITKAYLSMGLGLLVVIIYVAYAFRKASAQLSSYRYGVCAAIAMFHDAFLVLGFFAFLGYFYGIEIDSLFVTALLTIISFSVHDTIVIFDRVRENLKKSQLESFEEVVEKSVLEMFGRSLNTSIVIILVIISLLLFGGEAIKHFMLALLVGMFVGTYSSVFIAAPLLVSWKNLDDKKVKFKKD